MHLPARSTPDHSQLEKNCKEMNLICNFLAANLMVLLLFCGVAHPQNRGDLRLVQQERTSDGSASFSAGRLEIFINSTWGSVCSDNFDMMDAHVACRQLGYSGAISTDTSFHTPYGRGRTGPIWLDEVGCDDQNMLHLLSCPNSGLGEHDCDHFSDVAVVCNSQPLISASPQSMDVRLVGGKFRSQGRVEVYCNGRWGTVCGRNFQKTEADAICRDLGYTKATHFGIEVSSLSPADSQQPIWFQQLDCPGNAEDIGSCGQCSGVDYNTNDDSMIECSSHRHDVIIQCTYSIPYGSVRLVQGTEEVTQDRGRLEIFINGKWNTVCFNSFNAPAANIACQQLGFLKTAHYTRIVDTRFGEGSGPITDLLCTPENKALGLCSKLSSENCSSHHQDVALYCTNVKAPGTVTPTEGKKLLSAAAFSGIILGCCLILVLCCACCSVCSLHFYLVPYDTKKSPDQSGLYFIEHEGSIDNIDNVETSLDQKLSGLDSGMGRRRKGRSFSPDSASSSVQAKHTERYVQLDTRMTSAAVGVPLPQQSQLKKAESPVIPPPSVDSHGNSAKVHSPTSSPRASHPSSPSHISPALSKLSLSSSSSVPSPTNLSQATPSMVYPSPIPTTIPIPPPLRRQMEKSNNTATSPQHSPELARKKTVSVGHGPTLKHQTSEPDFVLKDSEGKPDKPVQFPLAVSHTASTQALPKSPIKGIMKVNQQPSGAQSLPHLESNNGPTMATMPAADMALVSDPALPLNQPWQDNKHSEQQNHVSFALEKND